MAKQLLYTDEARKKLLAGADKLAHAVGITLGPTGRNVILDKSFGGPTVTKDGVTVSKEIDLPDPFENMGAKLVNAVAQKTSDVAGDGTTTATILALSIYQEGLRNITAGANPMAVKRGIDKAVDAVVEPARQACPRSSPRRKRWSRSPRISANNDPTIGKLMADAFEKVGKDGVITVEEGKTSETTLEFVEGMQFDKGYISPYFVTTPGHELRAGGRARSSSTRRSSSNVRDMLPLLEKVAQAAPAAADHRRGRRERGAGRPGGQQAARHPAGVRGQGARLRRPPQGHARRHRRADRRPVHQRGPRPEAGERHAGAARHRPRRSRVEKESTHDHRRQPARSARRSRSASTRSARRWSRPRASTTRRSSANGWPS